MKVLTPLARPGLMLSDPVSNAEGLPLFGAGTRLTRRYLRLLHDEGVRVLDVRDDDSVERWERVPDVDEFVRELDDRFASVESDRRMQLLKQTVKDVYLDSLFELEL